MNRQTALGWAIGVACLAATTTCWAASGSQVRVESAGLLQGAAYGGRPVLAAAREPLAQPHIEFPISPGDLTVELDRGWKVIAGPADAVSHGPSVIAATKPMTLEWAFTVETPGARRAWLLARHSEVSAQGRDQAGAYEISLDGKSLSGVWRRLAVRNFGNAWLGWLDLGTVTVAPGEHHLRIATTQDWCFVDRFLLISSGADPARFAEELAAPRTVVARPPSGAVEIRRTAAPLEIVERIEPVGRALRLTGRIRWQGDPTVLRGITWRVPVAITGGSARMAFPGALPTGELPLPAARRRVWPHPRSGQVVFHDGKGRGLAALAYSRSSTADLEVLGTPDGPILEVRLNAFGRLRPGAALDLGQVLISPTRGDALQAAEAFAGLYRIAGLRPPPHRAGWAQDLAIYCAHPGGPIERGFAQPGGFNDFAQRLPVLARMGINALWLLPIFEHGDAPYSIYAPVDQFAPSHRLGTPEDLSALVDAAHRHGIKVLFDFVPHGPPQDSALAGEFADAICLDEDGARKTRWGWSFDYANPRWQQYMHDAAAHSARAFAIDGTRIDVFHGDANWDPSAPYLASYPILGGGLEMARAIRAGISGVRGSAFVLPESYGVDPAMWGVSDATYDAGLYFLLEDLARRDPPPDEWADTLSSFLELQGRALPPWALKMRFLANHDTVTSVFMKARPAAAFDYERSHALAAIAAFARGVPMIYQGEEDAAIWGGDFPSSVEFYTRLFNLRRRLEPLRRGAADYGAVRASPGVWTCLRRTDTAWAIAVVSLWPDERDVWLTLPADLSCHPEPCTCHSERLVRRSLGEGGSEESRTSNRIALTDAFSSTPLTLRGRTVRLHLPGYGIALLTRTRPSP